MDTALPQNDDLIIFEIIQEALRPFKVGYITVEVGEDHEGRYLKIWVDILPRHPIKITPDWYQIVRAPEWAAELVGVQAALALRSIRLPVDDHIHLGEE